ncbi:diacylglycerol/lipid kinase family protein [Pseudooceanicola onchidii]|uniref:diacylglycerol/lipid kinase family protein n=1 Tax=Pseudooceanicola onchidii TaxID=2562279 RepID=UPI0010AA91C6|nr:diacylglycerol kinase family protein [Pseudooceanicola onchidii]
MPLDTRPRPGAAPAPAGSTARSICVIANPGSGKRDPGLFDDIRQTICADGRTCDLREAKHGSEIETLARAAVDEGFDVVAAAGGDGTIAAVAGAIFAARDKMDRLPHLGIIPLGTFNYVARSLNIPQEAPAEAARLLLEAPDQPLAIGEVNGKVFLNNASLGAYPAILDQREGIYRKWGRSRVAAYWSVLRALSTLGKPLSMKIEVDGQRVRKKSPLAFVANSSYQIEEFALPGADDVRNGNFALYLAPDTGRYGLILRALRLAGRVARPGRDLEMIAAREVTITTRQSQRLVARDGEKERLSSPFRFRLHTDVMRVIAPVADDTPDT